MIVWCCRQAQASYSGMAQPVVKSHVPEIAAQVYNTCLLIDTGRQ